MAISAHEHKRPAVDISDATLWPKATMIVRHFPGVVRHY